MDFGDLTNHINLLLLEHQIKLEEYMVVDIMIMQVQVIHQIFGSNMGYYAIATKGNSTYFGELTYKGRRSHTGSNGTRGIFGSTRGGTGEAPTFGSIKEYVNIMTTGNAMDFGDMTIAGQILW